MLTLLAVYTALGLAFALFFFALGYRRIDPTAAGAGLLVRLIWVPAAIALWPVLILRWRGSAKQASSLEEGSPNGDQSL